MIFSPTGSAGSFQLVDESPTREPPSSLPSLCRQMLTLKVDLTVLQQVQMVVGEAPHRWVLLHLDAGAHL